MPLIDRIWLGTVQIGQRYGFQKNRPDAAQVSRLLDLAWSLGIRRFDTARVYGESERRIGRWIASTGNRPVLATKAPSLENLARLEKIRRLRESIETSRRLLGVDRLDYFLCHRVEDYFDPAVRDELLNFRNRGWIKSHGVSCYGPAEALAAMDMDGNIGLIQAPGSILDRRVLESPLPKRVREAKVRLVLRSLYLQGALLLPPEKLPDHLSGLAPSVMALRTTAAAFGTRPEILCIAHVLHRHEDSEAVLGFHSAVELQTLQALPRSLDTLAPAMEALDCCITPVRQALIDPRIWPRLS